MLATRYKNQRIVMKPLSFKNYLRVNPQNQQQLAQRLSLCLVRMSSSLLKMTRSNQAYKPAKKQITYWQLGYNSSIYKKMTKVFLMRKPKQKLSRRNRSRLKSKALAKAFSNS